jgi:hypothetical protein
MSFDEIMERELTHSKTALTGAAVIAHGRTRRPKWAQCRQAVVLQQTWLCGIIK